MENTGIVLKDYSPIKKRITILDNTLGKIEAIYKNKKFIPKISSGTIISYNAKTSNYFFKLEDINIIYIPINFGQKDLFFLHHLIELCYFFLPELDSSQEVFQFLVFIYKNINSFKTSLDKKKILCKFFKIIGVYPENETQFPKDFLNLISQSINSKVTEKDDLHKYINKWLLECIYSHSASKKFKTLNFLKSLK